MLLSLLSNTVNAQSGTVFRDFNSNGVRDAGEPLVAGIKVNAYNTSGALCASTTSAGGTTAPNYTLPTTCSGQVRVEFEIPSTSTNVVGPLASIDYPSASIAGNGTSVQFVNSGATNVNFAVNAPSDYCNTDPKVVTNCYVQGNNTGTEDVIVSFPYSSTGDAPTVTHSATANKVGTTWGLAYNKNTKLTFASAFVKRHSGLGTGGIGAIYLVDPNAAIAPTLWLDVETLSGVDVGSIATNATRGLTTATASSIDATAFAKVGKEGIGDIDISEDGKTLYVMNLFQKTVLEIDVATKTLKNTYSVPDPGCGANGTYRPFATKVYRGNLYIGVVCSGETSGNIGNFSVMKLVGTSFTSILSAPLSYPKGWVHATYANPPVECDNFESWTDDFANIHQAGSSASGPRWCRPQPMLSDIEFDIDGSMIIGFMDRTGHQTGYLQPNTTNTVTGNGYVGGDILRAYNNNGTFVLENAGTTLGGGGAGANGDGPGGGEYYTGERYPATGTTTHEETSQGGLALKPGTGEVLLTAMDPGNAVFAGGIIALSNSSGQKTDYVQLYASTSAANTTFGKAAGLGDLELVCSSAPIEIGNRVWKDTDKDGIQDPGEPALVGVTLVLYNSAGVAVDTTVSDANGNYNFSSATDPDVKANSAYKIQIVSLGSNASVTGLSLMGVTITPGETLGTNTGSTLANNDAFLSNNLPTVSVSTGDWGENNHTYDFGLIPCSLTIINTSASACFRDASGVPTSSVNINVSWSGVSNDSIAVTFNGVTKYIIGAGISGVDSRSMSFTVPAGYSGTATAQVVGNPACSVTSSTITTVNNCTAPPVPCSTDPGRIGGTVFQDYNEDGIKGAYEIGKDGIGVKVYDCDGKLVGTTTSDAAGNWFISGLDFSSASSKYRVEFSIPTTSGFQASASGTSNGTDVQFVSAASCNVDFGVNDPANYCEVAPALATVCYVNGLPSANHVLVTFPFPQVATTGGNSLADASEIGSTWGISYARNTKTLYTSTFLKRHVGILNNKLGVIYTQNMADTTQAPAAWLDVTTLGVNLGQSLVPTNVARGLGSATSPSRDSLVYDLIGKVGFGDIDISSDEKTLYFVNLHDQKLYAIDIASKTIKSGFPVTIPNTCGGTTGSLRPFGLKYFNDKIYIGAICDAQTSQKNSDLQANVFSYDGTTMTNVLSFPLNYPKGNPSSGSAETNKGWFPWTSAWPNNIDITVAQPTRGYAISYPQPVLSDIEFDSDGDIVLGFMDRFGHQTGAMNYGLGTGTKQFSAVAGGDILRADNLNGSFVLENNGTVGDVTSAGTNNTQGPGGGEFYFSDAIGTATNGHQENVLGGLAMSWGLDRVAVSTMDPRSFLTGGILTMNNSTGARGTSQTLYTTTYTTGSSSLTFGKSAGIGDVEAMCTTAPKEIGNRIWKDTDNDGIQDACEEPIAGVKVNLYKADGTLLATTTTNSNGEYYFKDYPDAVTGAYDTLATGQKLYVVVGQGGQFDTANKQLADGSGAKFGLTQQNSTLNNGNDQTDSDGFLASGINAAFNGYPVDTVTIGEAGYVNHTLDFGFTCKPVITATPKKQTVCGTGTASAFTRKVVSGYVSSQQWYGPLTDTTSAFTTKIAGAVDSTFTPSTLPAAGQTRYYAVIARNGDSLCADTAFVALTVSPKIILQATPTNALCSSGGGSIATTVSGGTSPYTYLWSNGATTSSITNVASGSYTITVTDAGGCTKDTTLVLTQPDSLSLSLSTLSVTCNAGTDGGLTSMLSGGKTPYSYEWYNGSVATGLYFSNNPAVTGLAAGVYTLKVIDANGCFKTKTVTVTQPIKINVAQSQKDNICFDQSKGEVYVKIGGGTPPVTIKWNVDGVYKPAYDGLDTLRNLKAGIYELVLTDINGCTTTVKDTLTQPDSLHIAFTKVDGLCSTGNKGSVNTTVTGGVAPYSYSWSNTEATANVANLVSGNYKLVVTDAKGCKDSITVFIDEEDCRVDVALKKTVDGVCERKVGDLVTFKVVVSRQDTTSQSTTVIIKDQISPDFLITSSTPTKGSFDVSTGLWSGIILTKGDSATLTVVAKIKVGAAGLLCNQAHVDFMDKLDIDSQAGNINPIEDDIAYACVTVPIDLCQADGHSVTLTTPDSLTSIKWFKDGIELTAEAGKTSITVSGAGSYTYTGATNGTSCPVGNCCPVIIKDACYGSIGDYVWNDNNINGKQDGGETPVAGVKVYLLDATTGAKLDSAITDINGKYLFDSLLTGTYKVQFVEPVGKDFTTFNTGGDTTKDSDAGVNGISGLINIDTTKPSTDLLRNNLTIDAGIIPQFGSIGDYVWTDQNNDGQQTAGENPIAGVKVYLYDNSSGSSSLIDSTVTDINGKYLFDSLLDGVYQLKFVGPAGTIPSKQNTGADVSDSDANKLGLSQGININTALLATDTLRNNPQIDAGFVPVGSLGDYVFTDKNGNGIQEATDTPIAGIKVYLTDNTGVKLDSTITDANGKYLFDSLLAGTYKVQVVIPAGSEATTKTAGVDTAKDSNINPDGTTDAVVIDTTLPLGNVGRDNPTIDAGIVPAYGSIGDYVWTDQNNDGQQTAGELPIAGVKVYLYDGTGTTKLDSTVTDANGKYLFDSLLTGSYKVQFVAPTGTIPSKQNTGADVSDSDANKLGFSQVKIGRAHV